ncbi:MAG: YqgQ family protein [Bacillus sp. (in: firmicutes)]
MQTIYDVQQMLKQFGTFIYIGNRQAELEMMEAEIRELHRSQLIGNKEFQSAILLLRREIEIEKEKGL